MNAEISPKEHAIDAGLLAILACPESHQPLQLMNESELSLLNQAVTEGRARLVSGAVLQQGWRAGLIREDKKRAYEIKDGLPILLVESGLTLD